jgi:hypothetical protein
MMMSTSLNGTSEPEALSLARNRESHLGYGKIESIRGENGTIYRLSSRKR